MPLTSQEAQATELGVHVTYRAAPGADKMMVGADLGVEASRARPHVDLLDFT
jgi:hypothetical protein